MDRRNIPETAERIDPVQLKKAMELILRSYKGLQPEELYREAIDCFDSLIEISTNSDLTKDFTNSEKIDLKYLVDGANFVISQMHFNSENNYYITLGLPKSATQEMIKERWKKLMLIYHPDRQIENPEWVFERAKKVNEASSVLRDPLKRFDYDKKLNEPLSNNNYIDRSFKQPKPQPQKQRGTGSQIDINFGVFGLFGSISRYFPQIVIFISITVAIFFIASNFMQNKSFDLENELLSNKNKKPATADVETEEPLKQIQKEIKQAPPINKEISYPIKKQLTAVNDMRKPESQEKVPDSSYLKVPENIAQKQPTPEVQPTLITHIAKPIIKMESLTVKEVEGLINKYINAYERGDIQGFLSLFSASAIENDTMNYDEIRRSYHETFSEKINYYRLNNINIKINDQTASVSANYNLSRFQSNYGWLKYSGNISWNLKKEDNHLKIVRINYDR